MFFSMTGYGSGRAESPIGSVTVEIRSVNSRFLDLAARLPQEFSAFEPMARQELQKRFQRGKIYLNVQFTPIPGAGSHYELNGPLLELLENACKARGEKPYLHMLLSVPGTVLTLSTESQQEELGRLFKKALGQAMEGFAAERAREGEALRQALLGLRASMLARLAVISAGRGEVVQKFRDRLKERMTELMGPSGVTLDPGRVEQEVAFFADKADLSEEVTRLEAHLTHFGTLLEDRETPAKGRALDFLSQEILREVNTIGSKARDLEITRQVLDLKNLVESLKEQVANLE